MSQLHYFVLLIVFVVKIGKTQLDLREEVEITDKSTIQITRALRTYRHGPIDGNFLASVNDDIVVTAGGIIGVGKAVRENVNFDDVFRQWSMWEVLEREDTKRNNRCSLTRIYNYGEEALFRCSSPGIYRVYAVDQKNYNWSNFNIRFDLGNTVPPSDIDTVHGLKPKIVDFPEKKLFWSNMFRLTPFSIELDPENDNYQDFLKVKTALTSTRIAESEPFSVDTSDYCYYWNYRIEKLSSTGHVAGDILSNSDNRGTYSSYDIYVWIIEPSATTYDEISVDDPNVATVVSEYSRTVTKRFHAKGLVPCLRRAHGSLEVVNIKWFSEDDAANLARYPHWTISIKLHEDRIISTLTDVAFSVASRQRVSLYKCFVGDTRIFLTLATFDFINRGKQRRDELNVDLSNIDQVRKDYIKNNKYLYGHSVVWGGPLNSRIYQPGSSRTDLLTITNPCKSQEFLASAGGRITLATGLLERRMASMKLVFLPGLQLEDANPQYTGGLPHLDYFVTADAAFTPTHLVFLMTDSAVFLHPYQINTKGIGLLSDTKKFRLGALVKRRWCAQTGYLTHNMLVPAFSQTGNFILIQLFPIEGSVNIWAKPAPESCAAENQGFVGSVNATETNDDNLRNETKIHILERVPHSDDLGREMKPLKPTKEERPQAKPIREKDDLQAYLANNGELFDDHDPHFSEKATNPASKRLGSDYSDYNRAVIYKLDDTGAKIRSLMEQNGLIPIEVNGVHELSMDDVQFTAVEKRYIIASRVKTDAIDDTSRQFVTMISTMTALTYPVKILRKKFETDPDPDLETSEIFPGCLFVRKKDFKLPNEYPLNADEIVGETKYGPGELTAIHVTLYTLNTALPTYVIDIGNVYVFGSLDGRFARPLSYYSRDKILHRLPLTGTNTPKFSRDESYHDIVVTEQGTLSVLWRQKKPIFPPATTTKESQSIAIGSVSTIEPLREMKPFTSGSSIFQWATPDNEILYGKYTKFLRPRYNSCSSPDADPITQLGCIEQPATEPYWCELSHFNGNDWAKPISDYFSCKMWTFNPFTPSETADIKDKDLKTRLENFKIAYDEDTSLEKLLICNTSPQENCFRRFTKPVCDPGQPLITDCVMPPPKYQSMFNLYAIDLLATPYYNLLKGNLQFPVDIARFPNEVKKDSGICPFSGFKVIKTDFDYAEIGYSTRITAEVSYFGKNVPREADLLVEFENVIGIKVFISSSVSEEKDQTTVTRTIDVNFQMTDGDLKKMEKGYTNKLKLGETADDLNLKDDARIFSITVRPSIVTLYCNEDQIIKTLQINVGCNPFSKMRLIAEATPLNRILLKTLEDRSAGDTRTWVTEGDFLSVPRETVHHRQRLQFKCKELTQTYCKIPYANLYGSNVFNISWRDPLLPLFEQFLTGYTRRVTGNIAIYDLLGSHVGLNLTRLQAGCYNNAQRWHKSLLEQQVHLGRNVSVHEDIYKHYKDCYDQTLPRETPMLLSESSFRLHNVTNNNSLQFERRPNPRNKIFIFRAVVVNTYYNRFTFCPNLDTIFLVKIVGIPNPRQALSWRYSIAITLVIMVILAFTYVHFTFCYPWKGGPDEKTTGGKAVEENAGDDIILNEEYLRDEEHIEFDFTQRVRTSEGFFERFAKKIYALTKWRHRAAEQVERRQKFYEKDNPEEEEEVEG